LSTDDEHLGHEILEKGEGGHRGGQSLRSKRGDEPSAKKIDFQKDNAGPVRNKIGSEKRCFELN